MKSLHRQPRYVKAIGTIGFVLLVTTFHRSDWLYTDPRVWWRVWQGGIAFILCCLAAALGVWGRTTPFTEPDADESDATIVLGLTTPTDHSH